MSKLRKAIEFLDLREWLSEYADIKEVDDTEIRLKVCPECGNENYKLYVNTEKKVWDCKRCGWGFMVGDVCVLMSSVSGATVHAVRMELLETTIPAPNNSLQELIEGLVEGVSTSQPSLETEPVPGVPLGNGMVHTTVKNYLYSRGLSDCDLEVYNLHAAAGIRKYKRPFAIFPISYAGSIVSWQGRSVINTEPKYLSSKNIANWLFPLKNMTDSRIILVEGIFDAIGLIRLGYSALCTFGKKLSNSQFKLLSDLNPSEITVAWDVDSDREIANVARRLSVFDNVRISVFTKLDGNKVDPGDYLVKPELKSWLINIIDNSIDIRSPGYLKWQLGS